MSRTISQLEHAKMGVYKTNKNEQIKQKTTKLLGNDYPISRMASFEELKNLPGNKYVFFYYLNND